MNKRVNHSPRPKRRARVRRSRSALAVVELAVCLPAIVLMVLGSIEACSMIFVKQSLHIAAYEGIRRAVRYDATEQIVLDRCQQILDERGVENATIELTPNTPDTVERGNELTLRISAPVLDNSLLRLRFFEGQLEAQATMVKE